MTNRNWLNGLRLVLIVAFTGSCAFSTAQESESKPKQHIKERDQVKLTVFGEESLTTTVEVTSEGIVSFPLIGDLQAAGKPAADLAQEVEALLEKDYIRDANVTIAIVEYRAPPEPPKPVMPERGPEKIGVVTFRGEVRTPGPVTLYEGEPLDLLAGLARAGDLLDTGSTRRVEIKRQGAAEVIRKNLSDLERDPQPFLLQPGDIVTVNKRVF